MKKTLFSLVGLLLAWVSFSGDLKPVTSPKTFFGYEPGADRKLIKYQSLVDYFNLLDKESEMVKIEQIGVSELGVPIYMAFISTAENIYRLPELKSINQRLALDGKIPALERDYLISKGKTFVMFTLSMHSTETAPSQAAPLMAYNLITGIDPEATENLSEVVTMMVISSNPDGHDMIVDHYNKYLGTIYEGSNLPGVYHKYVGHNINRDFISLLMKENKAVSNIYSNVWFPQILVDKHQMHLNGPRYYVPPNHDPIAENIDETIWVWNWVLGSNMTRDMTARGLKGISQKYLFDFYWPGPTKTSAWKNIISLLTEAASVQLASPVFIEPNELRGGKGLPDYKKSINFPVPWEGGWWHLSDIVQYEVESTYSIIKSAGRQKVDFLTSLNNLVSKEIEKGKSEPPYYFVIPQEQHDKGNLKKMISLLNEHGVKVHKLENDVINQGRKFDKGDFVISLAQPFRPFIKEIMEPQKYPVRRYSPGGEIIMPYDITSWSLPLNFGLNALEINTNPQIFTGNLTKVEFPLETMVIPETSTGYFLFNGQFNESYKLSFKALANGFEVWRSESEIFYQNQSIPGGSFVMSISARVKDFLKGIAQEVNINPEVLSQIPDGFHKVRIPKIALVESWLHDMDAGWTRFLFDTYGIPYTVLRPGDIASDQLSQNFDVVIFPDMGRNQLMMSAPSGEGDFTPPFYPPQYLKGIGNEGWQNILEFIQNGGRAISWGSSIDLFTGKMEPKAPTQSFRFPISNVAASLRNKGLNIPGSHLALYLAQNHPLTLGMPRSIAVFHRANVVLETSIPTHDIDRRVIGRFPPKDILISGYAENISLLESKPAMVLIEKGKGQVVLFSFVPNFRGATSTSHKLIFNSLLWNTSK